MTVIIIFYLIIVKGELQDMVEIWVVVFTVNKSKFPPRPQLPYEMDTCSIHYSQEVERCA